MAEKASGTGALKLDVRDMGGRIIVAPDGALTYEECRQLDEALAAAAKGCGREIILDLKAVPLVDSEALECLWKWHEEIERQGGILKIISPNDVCRDIFIATRLVHVFHVYDDLARAVGA